MTDYRELEDRLRKRHFLGDCVLAADAIKALRRKRRRKRSPKLRAPGKVVALQAEIDALRAIVARLTEALEIIADATNAPCTCGAGCEEIAAAAIAGGGG